MNWNWREILGMSPSAETSYTHNSHNTQKYPETTHCADIADSAYRDSEQENAQLPGALAIATLSLAGGACWGNRRMIRLNPAGANWGTNSQELNLISININELTLLFGGEYGSQQVVAAARPVHPLGKCLASVPLLAWVLVAKYADALPLYRLEGILKRHGGRISRTTLANWIIRLDDVFQPLINLLREQQRSGDYLQADETRLQVLKERGKAPQSDKWMWLIRGGPPDRPVVLYEYDPSRSEEVPLRLLDGFKGTLQTDGYAGYNKVCREQGLTRIGCWDHARRKFVEASKAAPAKRKGAKVSKADVAIGKIRKLYAIEKRIRDLDLEEKTRQRQQRAQPVLDDLKAWLEKNVTRVPRNSLTYQAMQYTLNQWELLIGYLADGRLHISNALAENAIRPFAVGRKNWLFADTPRGAKASATVYSLIETAKANGLEPFTYLHHVLQHIGAASTVEDIEALLPWNVDLKGVQEG